MEETKNFIKNLLREQHSAPTAIKRNLIKEYLQILVLDYIYSHPKYSDLVFYGGSCLAHCYKLPRLSEDLDFVDARQKIKCDQLADDLENYFQQKTDLKLSTKARKFRIYLKFPILRELDLAGPSESDLLFLKIEVFSGFGFCQKYKTDIIPLFTFNKSILIKAFDLPTLFATKLRAILYRQWEKKNKKGEIVLKVKGRDYFDLMWYLQKAVKPNLSCLREFKNINQLKAKLLENVAKIDTKNIALDLESLIADKNFVLDLSKNIKEVIRREIEQKL